VARDAAIVWPVAAAWRADRAMYRASQDRSGGVIARQ
jgi:hypothetical protein